jgi:hypothetical protein
LNPSGRTSAAFRPPPNIWPANGRIEHEYEPELASALEEKTARILAKSPVTGARLVSFAVVLAVLLVVVLALALMAPGGLTALERTAIPFSHAHYTSVVVKPGDFDIPVGSNAEITNIFSGRLPKDARFSWAEAATSHWQTAALTGGTQGTFVHTLTNLQTDPCIASPAMTLYLPVTRLRPTFRRLSRTSTFN